MIASDQLGLDAEIAQQKSSMHKQTLLKYLNYLNS
jgi:hypothetical protein